MAESLIDLIKVLRERTGAGLMDCKGALLSNDCDLDKACDWLREKGLAKAAKKASRIAAEGLALVVTCDKCGKSIIIELNCETDFVAKGDAFKELVNSVATTILKNGITNIDDAKEATKELIADATVKMGEKFDLRRFVVVEKTGTEVVGTYIHMGGKIATLVKLCSGDAEFAKQLAMHICSSNPSYIKISDIPADVLAHERDVQRETSKADPKFASKPAEFQEKILDGKVNKYFAEMTLENQPFLMDDSKTVGQILKEKGICVKQFVRYAVGEGIEKRQDDFATEVMNQIKQ